MKERPILFSAPMVRAILDGRKTQTRRIVKPQPPDGQGAIHEIRSATNPRDVGAFAWFGGAFGTHWQQASPYGLPGDRLWCQEGQRLDAFVGRTDRGWEVTCHYLADGAARRVYLTDDEHKLLVARKSPYKANPGRFMYRSCSRLLLSVESVRVERLHDITEEDARAEGAPLSAGNCDVLATAGYARSVGIADAKETHAKGFAYLWRSINGADSWHANPWVWCISFRRVADGERGRL